MIAKFFSKLQFLGWGLRPSEPVKTKCAILVEPLLLPLQTQFLLLPPVQTQFLLLPPVQTQFLLPLQTRALVSGELISLGVDIFSQVEKSLHVRIQFQSFLTAIDDFEDCAVDVAEETIQVFVHWGRLHGYVDQVMRYFYRMHVLFIVALNLFSPYTWEFHNLLDGCTEWFIFHLRTFVELYAKNLSLVLNHFLCDRELKLMKFSKQWVDVHSQHKESWVQTRIAYKLLAFTFSHSKDAALFFKGTSHKFFGVRDELLQEYVKGKYSKPGYHVVVHRKFFKLCKAYLSNSKKVLSTPDYITMRKVPLTQSELLEADIFTTRSGSGLFIQKYSRVCYALGEVRPLVLQEPVKLESIQRLLSTLNYMGSIPFYVNTKILNKYLAYRDLEIENFDKWDKLAVYGTYFKRLKGKAVPEVSSKVQVIEDIQQKLESEMNELSSVKSLSLFIKLSDKLSFHQGLTNYVRNDLILQEMSGKKVFFLNFIVDSRFRNYVFQQSSNLQLYHILRSMIYFRQDSLELAAIKLLDIFNSELLPHTGVGIFMEYKPFYAQSLEEGFCLEVLHKVSQVKFLEVSFIQRLKAYIHNKEEDDVLLRYLPEALYWQSILELLDTLNNVWVSDFSARISKGLENLLYIKQILSPTWESPREEYLALKGIITFLDIKARKVYLGLGFILNLTDWLKSRTPYFTGLVENDATANATELFACRSFVYDDHCLRLLNIWENNTEYSDIYEYSVSWVRSNLGSSIEDLTPESREALLRAMDRELMKGILMPSVYGQTTHEALKKIHTHLNNQDFQVTQERQEELLLDILECIFGGLKDINFNFKEHVLTVKAVAKMLKENFMWKSDWGLVVNTHQYVQTKIENVIKKQKKLTREGEILKKISKILGESTASGFVGVEDFLSSWDKQEGSLTEAEEKVFYRIVNSVFRTSKLLLKTLDYDEFFKNPKFPKVLDRLIKKESLSAEQAWNLKTMLREKAGDGDLSSILLSLENYKDINMRRIDQVKKKLRKRVNNSQKDVLRDKISVHLDEKAEIRANFTRDSMKIDFEKIVTSSTANTTHQRDASIALRVVELCKTYDIPLAVVHDAFYTSHEYSFHIKIIYKIAFWEAIQMDRKELAFPYNHIPELLLYISKLGPESNWFTSNGVPKAASRLLQQIENNRKLYDEEFLLCLLHSKNLLK